MSYALPLDVREYDRKKNINAPTYSGKVTDHAAKRIRRTCEILLMRSPQKTVWNTATGNPSTFRLTFATITFSARELIDHHEAYEKGLKPLLRWLRTKQGWNDYIWKVELQARGQIHYHITGNNFVDWRELKARWNNIQYGQGWLHDYHERTGSWAPNSTDIHAVGKVERLDLYLAKYISKTGGQIRGKVWDCSKSLAGKKYFTFEPSYAVQDDLNARATRGDFRKIVLENCTIFEGKHPEQIIPATEQTAWQAWKRV